MCDLSAGLRVRIAALQGAGQCVEPGTPTSTLLSRASQCETYLLTGLVRTGPRWESGAEVGVEGVSVMVYGPGLTPEQLEGIGLAVRAVL